MNVNSPGSVSSVFTAPLAGFYSLALELNGSQTLELNASVLSGFGAQGAYVSRVVFLDAGDVIGYQGPSAELHIGVSATL